MNFSETFSKNYYADDLSLESPIFVKDVTVGSYDRNRVDVYLDMPRGSKMSCPSCGASNMPIHDKTNRIWRHLNTTRCQTYIHFNVPRINCESCGVKIYSPNWARPGSHFTLLMEYYILALATRMSVINISDTIAVNNKTIFHIIDYYVRDSWVNSNWSNLRHIGIDETSKKKDMILYKVKKLLHPLKHIKMLSCK